MQPLATSKTQTHGGFKCTPVKVEAAFLKLGFM
jgi:hypothetical protein